MSLDLAAAAFALGSGKIKLPHLSAAVLSMTGAFCLVMPALLGDLLNGLNRDFCHICGKILLFILGGTMVLKYFINKKRVKDGYADRSSAEYADKDCDHRLSFSEAAIMSVGLSTDSAVTGFSAGLSGIEPWECAAMFLCGFIIGFAAAEAGAAFGKRMSHKVNISSDMAGGIILLLLSVIV